MNVLGYRTVSDVDGKPYQVADVLLDGAILPVSIPTSEINPVDEAQVLERDIETQIRRTDSLITRVRNDALNGGVRYPVVDCTNDEPAPIIYGGELYTPTQSNEREIPF